MKRHQFHLVWLVSLLALSFTLVPFLMWTGAASDFGFGISDFRMRNGPNPHFINPPSNSTHCVDRNPQSGRPWINLRDGVDVPTVYTGAPGLKQVLEHGLAVPLALASADFDEDGVPDLVSGYVGPSGGILTLHRGNIASIYPNSPEARRQTTDDGQRTTSDQRLATNDPFLPEAGVFELPEAPDFLGTGDFDADSHWDVVTAARGSDALYLLSGNGHGDFRPAKPIALPGAVTALVTGEINRRDGLDDVVVGVIGSEGPKVLVFEWPEGALRGQPEAIPLPAAATALALGQLDESYEMDLAVAAGNELVIVHGRDRRLSLDEIRRAEVPPAIIEQRAFAFEITSIALGDFVWDQAHRTEIALLSDDGTVHVLINPNGVEEDAGAHGEASVQRRGTDATSVGAAVPGRPPFAPHLREWPSDVLAAGLWLLATRLVRAKVSSLPTDDLVVLDPANHQLHILMTGDGTEINIPHSAFRIPHSAVAVLPMRLNVDALSDLVILTEGSSTPAVALTAPMTIFVVNSNGNESDADQTDGVCSDCVREPITGMCARDAQGRIILNGVCSLTAAVIQANFTPGADAVHFNISGGGVQTITLAGGLLIGDSVTIDGTSQPGFAGKPLIELDGSKTDLSAMEVFFGGGSTVRGLVINRFGDSGIILSNDGGNIIEGNFIGTDVTGTADLGNRRHGVVTLSGFNNTIGGTMGTTPGGPCTGACNLISGNDGVGIIATGSGNGVQGNYIGTDITGQLDLGNASDGVRLSGTTSTTIGGTAAGAGNLISGNDAEGVQIIFGAAENMVQGNYIGTDVMGTADLGNGGSGVTMDSFGSNNTLGGTTAAARNLISGNNGSGVIISGGGAPVGNVVQGNFIGTQVDGTSPLGNTSHGVFMTLFASNRTIGGTAVGAGNTIAFNGGDGVSVESGIGNAILSNSIFSNAGLGIDLGADGVTLNDSGDPDFGANNLQNFPILSSVLTTSGSTTIQGTLNSTPNTSFTLEFFSNTECDPPGHGEGARFIGSTTVTTDSSGNANFTVSFPTSGRFITATATDPNGNTSEFSNCLGVGIQFNGTESDLDDFVVVTDPATPNRPFTPLVLTLHAPAGTRLLVNLTFSGAGKVGFDNNSPTLTAGAPVTIKVYGERKSSAENDTKVQVRNGGATGEVLAEQDFTVITGIKIQFRGTFLFMVENNNGQRVSDALGVPPGMVPPMFTCDGDPNPLIWGTTPLPCEGLRPFFQRLIFEEGQTAAERWSLASGKRPKIEVMVTGVKSFDPEVNLDGRDRTLMSGMPVMALNGRDGIVGVIVTDDCDNDPATGNPLGQEDGVEAVLNFGYRFGDSLGLKYRDVSTSTIARIWTTFPSGGITPAHIAGDQDATNMFFFPGGATGCTSLNMTYFDQGGVFQCQQPQTVRELFLRNAGFRSFVRQAWANWTSRQLVLTQESQFGNSFIAKLFNDAMTGHPSNPFAETFIQFFDYDWYTLVGKIEKGVAATPGGIAAKFEEWAQRAGCPSPRQPDEAFSDDPF